MNIEDVRPVGLRECIRELFEWHNTGVLKKGLVRDFADDIVFKTTSDHSTKLKIAKDVILKEAARRYLVEED